MDITLRRITQHNFDAIADLELPDHQQRFVATNSYSIAQASFDPEHKHTRAIYVGDAPAGFLMYVDLAGIGHPGEWGIWRVMVARPHQGKGVARTALGMLLDDLRARPGASKIWISYMPDNAVAQAFYRSLGFVEQGIDAEDGEMQAVIELPRG